MQKKLTKEQEAYLPVFRKEYFDIATSPKRIDRVKLEAAINDAYSVIGKKKPMVMIFSSPAMAMMAIKVMEHFKEIGDKDQLRGQLGDQLRGQLGDQKIWNPNFLWGSQDMYWIAWAKFSEHIWALCFVIMIIFGA